MVRKSIRETNNDQIMKGIARHTKEVIFYTKNKWELLKAFNQRSNKIRIKSWKGNARTLLGTRENKKLLL